MDPKRTSSTSSKAARRFLVDIVFRRIHIVALAAREILRSFIFSIVSCSLRADIYVLAESSAISKQAIRGNLRLQLSAIRKLVHDESVLGVAAKESYSSVPIWPHPLPFPIATVFNFVQR